MAKNRNKKKKDGAAPMEVASETHEDYMKVDGNSGVSCSKPFLGVVNRKLKKTAPTRRSKAVRKTKALEKAISKNEKTEERISKHKNKISRIRSAKTLYE
ncbi:hypothetical protein EJ110_NYTH49534 [Nymphaea thermarum]|nr:hypothetical protein EJ110_NYTH49534 [Nymphaea thermarum]